MRTPIIGVMGPGNEASKVETDTAYELGKSIVHEGWIVLNGGRRQGVMDAVSKGGRDGGGVVLGISFADNNDNTSDGVTISVVTGMGSARNNINVLTSDIVVACGLGAGTASEISLALKAKKKVILIKNPPESVKFFKSLSEELVFEAQTVAEVIEIIKKNLNQ